ncbi:MAG: hypothetical protein ACREFW_05895 [Rhizomicrobium sp.]
MELIGRGEGLIGLSRKRSRGARFIVALIALLTFTLQTYVVQTHIHTPSFEFSGFGQVNHPSPLDNKDNPDNCPICQAFATAGFFVTPALVILALALSFIGASRFVALKTTAGPLLARNWQSRAPPKP